MSCGWIGSVKSVLEVLQENGADTDEEGCFILGGEPPIYGLGKEEVVVHPMTMFKKADLWFSLSSLMKQSGCEEGISVVVF